jgi:hypothetical protein
MDPYPGSGSGIKHPGSATLVGIVYFDSVLRIRDVLSRIWIRPFSHPGSVSKHFFIPDPGSYMKSGMQTFFLAYSGFRSKALFLVTVKKIRDPEKFIPDPDPGSMGYR